MKGSMRSLRHQREVQGRFGGGVRGEEEEKTADQRRGSSGWMKAKMRKKWVNVAPVIKKNRKSGRKLHDKERETRQNKRVLIVRSIISRQCFLAWVRTNPRGSESQS